MFTRAIVRPPGPNFAEGLTSAALGQPSFTKALDQHRAYCSALESCGLALTRLEPDARYPDSTFVEDTAVLTAGSAVFTRPGARSREGEVEAIREAVEGFFPTRHRIVSPGTLDGGDICEAGRTYFIGISDRTNEAGARQLADVLTGEGYTCVTVDIRGLHGILHLKSGIAYIGDGRLLCVPSLAAREEFGGLEIVPVPEGEEYAGNCVRINDRVLIAAGFSRTQDVLCRRGYSVMPLEMSEYRKMDGGLTCLSLRF